MTEHTEASTALARKNKALALKLVGITFGMSVFAFALVPLYDVFCEVFGINGKIIGTETVSAGVDLSREVKVEFVAQVDRGMAWDFEPLQKSVVVHPGEQKLVSFRVRNRSDANQIGQAIYSVAPGPAALFINKTECFCFRQQPLDAGKSADLTMAFFVDKDLPKHIQTVSMQYTLYNVTEQLSKTAQADSTVANK